MTKLMLKILVPVVLLAFGVVGAVVLVSARKAPPRTERVSPGPLVEVRPVSSADVDVQVRGNGEVVARTEVDLVPQVGGRVEWVHRALVAGGRFRAGEPLVQIERRDYELLVERALAAVERARVVLEREQAEAEVARQEWEALHPREKPPSGLVVREPQVRQAEAELAAARAELDAARLNLERTRLSVPFDGIVVSEDVGVGQYVTAGARLARVYGTDVVEVRVPLEDRELAWFEIPEEVGDVGPAADVSASFAGARHTWKGRVVRLESRVDPASRMVHVVVEVGRPFDRSDGRPPLLPGAFVDVAIGGRTLAGVVPVPRHAIHGGDTVWLVEDGRLRIRPVEIARSDRETALVSAGLESGDVLVVSPLDAATDGMKVRPAAPTEIAEPAAPVAGGAA